MADSECDSLDINNIGQIQNVGYVLAIDKKYMKICHVSSNMCDLPLSVLNENAADFIDMDLSSCFLSEAYEHVHSMVKTLKLSEKNDTYFIFEEKTYFLTVTDTSSEYVIEIVNTEIDYNNFPSIFSKTMGGIVTCNSKEELFENISSLMMEYTEYQRLIMYEFNLDFSGKVVNEWINPNIRGRIDEFIDLTFPASDMPLPARRMYSIRPIRIIYDTSSEIVEILGRSPLNMSKLITRGVHKVHLEYTKNMGIKSSMSIGIFKDDGNLDSIVSAHSYDYVVKPTSIIFTILESMSKPFSQTLSRFKKDEFSKLELYLNLSLNKFSLDMDLLAYISEHHMKLMEITNTDCISLLEEGIDPISYGDIELLNPENDLVQIKLLEDDFLGYIEEPFRGVIYVVYDKKTLVFFRNPKTIETKWGGDPNYVKKRDNNGCLIARKSFERHVTREHKVIPWTNNDEKCASIIYDRIVMLSELNNHINLHKVLNKRISKSIMSLTSLAQERPNKRFSM